MTYLSKTDGASPDDAMPVFPFYLVVDVSYSMSGDIDDLNKKIVEFRDTLKEDPMLDDIVLFGIISFSGTAKVEIPLCNFADADLRPDLLQVSGATSYAAAFDLLRTTIDTDVDRLKAEDARRPTGERFKYFRPAAFFLTDGEPTDNEHTWKNAFSALTGMKRYPLFVPFGFRDAPTDVLQQLVYPLEKSRLYQARDNVSVGQILEQMLKVMLHTVQYSAYSATTTPQHVMPEASEVGPAVQQQQYVGGDWM